MTVRADYEAKRTDPERAIDHIRDNDTIVVPIAAGEPPALLTALSARRFEFTGVTVYQLLALGDYDYLNPDSIAHVRNVTSFIGGPTRAGVAEGWVEVIPANFSEIPQMFDTGVLAADVVFAQVSPMNEHGYFALGLSADYTMAALRHARAVVLEVNPQLPFTHGNCHIHIEQVSALVDAQAPVVELPNTELGPVERQIAAHAVDLIPDAATLQIGIGAIPDAVVGKLMNRNDLGIHSEMFGTGIMSLCKAGVVTNRYKNLHPGKMMATFALGSAELYEWMHDNPALHMHPVEAVNPPDIASRNDLLHSINSSIQIDLYGQCASESIGARLYSGPGGQVDFIRAANRSKGGKAIIALPSTAVGGTMSRIVPTLPAGVPVTTSKNDVNYVVTEYGVAQLRGTSLRDRARALIEIAHPGFRDQLTEQAQRIGLR